VYLMIRRAIACDDPVAFFEPKRRYWDKGEVDMSATLDSARMDQSVILHRTAAGTTT
jgi:pyruvate dehydrogenase E1 component beta subunit